jgi:hypothetical protein
VRARLAAYREIRELKIDEEQIPNWMKTPGLDGEEVPILEVPASKAPIEKVASPYVTFIEVSTLGNLPQGAGTPSPGAGVPLSQEGSIAEDSIAKGSIAEDSIATEDSTGDQDIGSKLVSREIVPKPVDELSELPVGAATEVPPEAEVGLEQVYQQNDEIERQLRRQNIIQLSDGSHIQAARDVGGVALTVLWRYLPFLSPFFIVITTGSSACLCHGFKR